jgi:hypothetical protein
VKRQDAATSEAQAVTPRGVFIHSPRRLSDVLFEFVPLKFLTKAEIEAALARLSELAAAEGVRLEMTLYGGAVMLLAYDARSVTKDVDAIIHPPKIGRRLVEQVGAERGLHAGWLNDDVKQFVSMREAKNELPIAAVGRDGLHITRPTAKYLLAMKVMASRKPMPGYAGDFADIETLLRVIKLKSVDDIEKIVESFFPDTVLPDSVRLTLTDLLEKIHHDLKKNAPSRAPADGARRRAPRGQP